MRFDKAHYLYPPRPEVAVAPTTLAGYEAKGWLAQPKMNGTSAVITVMPGSAYSSVARGRHGPDNRLTWQPAARWSAFRECLPGAGYYVFVAELLHSKGAGVRDTVYLHDMLVEDGEYLVGTSYRDRLAWLTQLCEAVPGALSCVPDATHRVIMPGIWLANSYSNRFAERFAELRERPRPLVEGLVLKQPEAELLACGRASANAAWQHKCRTPTDHLCF